MEPNETGKAMKKEIALALGQGRPSVSGSVSSFLDRLPEPFPRATARVIIHGLSFGARGMNQQGTPVLLRNKAHQLTFAARMRLRGVVKIQATGRVLKNPGGTPSARNLLLPGSVIRSSADPAAHGPPSS